MPQILRKKAFCNVIASITVLCLLSFVSFPVLIHVHHDNVSGEHVTHFHKDFVNHSHLTVEEDPEFAESVTDDLHVIESTSDFVSKQSLDDGLQLVAVLLCLILTLPLLHLVNRRLITRDDPFPTLLPYSLNPPLRAPPASS